MRQGRVARESRVSPRGLPGLTVAVVILLTAWVWWLERPPAALSADASPERFSAMRAMRQLHNVAARPHMPGSAEHRRVREYLVAELGAAGFEVEVHQTTVTRRFGGVVRAVTVRNVAARKRGTGSTGGVALAAHYDTQQLPAGAGDDGTGVVAILETVRALQHGPALRNDLYVLITDAEELGLMGARGFVDEHPWWNEIDLLLSFEARGAAGQAVMFETSVDNGWVVREFARADPYPTGSSLYYEIYQRLPNDTDFSVFKGAGVTGLNFAMVEGADRYHRPIDTIENLSPATVQHHGEHALSLVRHFGQLDLAGTTTAPDIVFFRAGPLGLITYGAGWAFPLALVASAFVVVLVLRGRRAGVVRMSGVGTGFVLAVVSIAVSAGSSWLMWVGVRGAHHELGSIVGRALYDESWYGLALAALAVGIVSLFLALVRRRFDAPSLALGALALPLALALLSGWFIPGISMLFQWPALFAAIAVAYLLVRDPADGRAWVDLAVLAAVSVPIIAILFPLTWGLYVGLNISAAPAIGGSMALWLVLLIPLLDMAQQDDPWWLPVSAVVLAVVLVAVGWLGARPGPHRPIPSDLVYALDRETGEALWATMQVAADGWVEGFVDLDTMPRDLAPFLAGNQRPYRASVAPSVDTRRASVAVVADSTDGRSRRVRLEIRSTIGPELIMVSPASGSDVRLVAVNGSVLDDGRGSGNGGGAGSAERARDDDWLLQHFGEPPEGSLLLDLSTESLDRPVSVVIVEQLMRFPPIPGMDLDRPAGWVAHARRLTDVSLFRQVEILEPVGGR